MPNYEYRCAKCCVVHEFSHSINEAPIFQCPDCGRAMSKMISRCNFSVHDTAARNRTTERIRKEHDMVTEMRDDFGIEKFTPLKGNTTETVYRDVKAAPGLVREKMAAEKEKNERKTKAKQREWAIKANRRVAERTAFANEKKAEEAAAKRAITVN